MLVGAENRDPVDGVQGHLRNAFIEIDEELVLVFENRVDEPADQGVLRNRLHKRGRRQATAGARWR